MRWQARIGPAEAALTGWCEHLLFLPGGKRDGGCIGSRESQTVGWRKGGRSAIQGGFSLPTDPGPM